MTPRSPLSTNGLVFLALLVLTGSFFCLPSTVTAIGGDTGYFEITSDPSGGIVYFDGAYLGPTPVTYTVFVTGTPSHTIRVTKPGYNDWQQNYQGNPAAGETIAVNADLVFIPVTQQTTLIGGGKGYYYITSYPSGGSVNFDGDYKGTTPVTVEVASQGTPGHTVSISLQGYETWSTSLAGNPASGQTIPVTAYLTAIQSYGSIAVTSDPSGATAVLDGGSSQITPCTFTGVSPGSHTISVSKGGYTSISRTVTVSGGSTTQVAVTLTKVAQETGTIYVVSTPQGANAYVDGVYYGITPALANGLDPGNHQVRISLSGFQDWIGTVFVTSGATTTVTQTLRVGTTTPTQAPTQSPATGSVMVSSTPSSAQVFMDNVYQGISPLTIASVQPGTHSFLIKQTGYADWQVSEPVQSGQTTQIAATLSPLPTPTEGAMPSTLVLLAVGLLFFGLLSRRK
jgi:hypothetical protein